MRLFPPWSQVVVDKLNERQKDGRFHPYTCGNCRGKLGVRFYKLPDGSLTREFPPDFKSWEGENWKLVHIEDRELVATVDGWICPTCDYKQAWVNNPNSIPNA
jgi:hypothetical protein